MLDKILENLEGVGNLDELAAKVGLPADQIQTIVQSLSGKLGQGGDPMSALMTAAQEHGISADNVKDLFKNFVSASGENPVTDFANMLAKGVFGGKE